MRPLLYPFNRATLSLLVILLLSALTFQSHAQSGSVTMTQSFSYTGQIVTWTVPTGVTSLTIEARGAEGGDVDRRTNPAGKGAVLVARVDVSPGQSLSILVGQQNSGRGAGGGGSFVVGPGSPGSPKPLVIAGGGGGAGAASPVSDQAKHGQLGQSGGAGGGGGAAGGNGGAGGEGRGGGGGGGGLLGDGGDGGYSGAGGKAFINGGAPGNDGTSFGSFGGGGAGQGAGAGAGGYSGGGTGEGGDVGGGGGSITTGDLLSSRTGATDGNSGNGLVIISYSISTIRYVKPGGTGDGTSWDNASGDLQSQINIAGAQQVWVAGGRYTTTANNGSFSLKNGVSVYGGFAGSEQNLTDRPGVNPVNGQLSSTTLTATSRSVFSNNGLDNTARLDGVVITGGDNIFGGGIYNSNSSPVLTNCLISGNTTSDAGGGIYNANSSPVLTNCLISGNSASNRGGGIYTENGIPSLTNCVISGNSADQGGGISNYSSSPSLTNCTISSNTASSQGGGIYNRQNSSPVLTNCLLANNTATNQGGAFHNYQSSNPRLVNCTLTGNSAGDQGGAISEDRTASKLTNAILWNNGGAKAFRFLNGGSTSLTYSLIESGATSYTSSPTNQTATVSPFMSGTDFTLRAGSQAIDAGDPASTTATSGTTDLAGNPRVFNNRIDIGAYEFQGPFCQPVAITQQPASGSSVCAGTTVTAMVSVTGTSPTYQWYKGSALVSGQRSATLTLANVQPADAGSYSVVVTGTCPGSVTSTAFSLTVNALPSVSITPATQTICQGQSATFTAQGASTYQWSTGQTSPGISVSATGTYSATGTTNSCSATATASLTVNPVPTAPMIATQSGHSYPGGVSSLTIAQNVGNVILMVSGCAGGTITWAGGSSNTLAVSTMNTGRQTFTATCTQNGCPSLPATATVTVVPTTLSVLHRDGNGQVNTNTLSPYLELQNDGNTAIPYAEITVRYWLTVENYAPLLFSINYAQLGSDKVHLKYVPAATGNPTATGYIEFSFDASAGNLGAMSNSGPIQDIINKQDYSSFDQSNDYSYVNTGQYTPNPRITAYRNGVIFYGMEPGPVVPMQSVKAMLQNNTGADANSIEAVLSVTNDGNIPINYGDIKVRYYFTVDNTQPLVLSQVGYTALGSGNVSAQIVTISPPLTNADRYLELSFSPGLGQLAPGASTGGVTYQIRHADYSGFNQTNDYSYQGTGGTMVNPHVVVFVAGKRAYGSEPTLGARQGVEETGKLSVSVLGNPITGSTISVSVRGAEGQALRYELTDVSGHVVGERQVEQAGGVDEQSLSVGHQPAGLLLLRVSTPTQSQTVKVLRQ